MIPFYVLEAVSRYCNNLNPDCSVCPFKTVLNDSKHIHLTRYEDKRWHEIAFAKRRLKGGNDPTLTADPTRY